LPLFGGGLQLGDEASGFRPASSAGFACGGSPAKRRKASDICTRPLTPVMTTSTIVKEEWKWPRA